MALTLFIFKTVQLSVCGKYGIIGHFYWGLLFPRSLGDTARIFFSEIQLYHFIIIHCAQNILVAIQ